MLTPEDMKNLGEYLIDIFPSKKDFEDLRKDFRNLQTSVDNYSKKTDTYHQELAIYKHKVNSLEDWVKQAAVKLGLDYNP